MIGFRRVNISEDSELIRLYEEKIKKVIQRMPRGLSFEEKVEYLYSYLVNELEYDYACLERNVGGGTVEPSLFEDDDENVPEAYRNKGTTGSPMSAFLHKKALCAATSKIFKDLCDRSGIKCEICQGKTAIIDEQAGIRRGHAWNIVEDEYGRRSHVDVTYGRFVKDKHKFDKCENRKVEDFCMVNDEDLCSRGPHTIEDGTKPCNYTVINHQQVQESLLKKLNGEELETNDIQH